MGALRVSAMGLIFAVECGVMVVGSVLGMSLAPPGIMVASGDDSVPDDSLSAAADE